MSDATKVRLGLLNVNFNGIDLGFTKGGAEVMFEPEFEDITVDQFGKTPIDKVLVAEKFSVKMPLAEETLANLKVSMPTGTLTTSGGKTKLTLGRDAGYKLSTNAARLILHPRANAAEDISEDIILWKAVSVKETKLDYKIDGQTVIEVEFMALVDTGRANGQYLGLIGDSTI